MTQRQPDIALPNDRVLIVITGALPAAFLPGWLLCLREWYGWDIRVCVTHAAARLVSCETLAAASGNPVLGPDWRPGTGRVDHREAADWPDAVLVVPATANWIGKYAHGITDSLALAATAFTTAPVVVAPSLGPLAERPAVRRNLRTLREDGVHVVPTGNGVSAHNGTRESGAMPSIDAVLEALSRVTATDRKSAG
ncbi:flavoprotein [Streptomyces anulatus]|uniref:flavoprotein n=1 Tax=Streptomyces anulatus TaxID=1892 RepID=UPI003692D95A